MTPTKKYSVFLVDDHPVVRSGLQSEIESDPDLTFAGSASSLKEGIRKMGFFRTDLLLSDVSLQDENGIQEIESIKSKFPELKIVFLTMHRDWAYLQKAFALGADGYLLKSESTPSILNALKTVLAGGKVFPEEVKNFRPESEVKEELGSIVKRLTKREREILNLLADGKLNREIADQLELSVRTVETHRASIFKKLETENIIELGRILIQLKSSGLF
ncbi:response regulator transcription factor [Leptospira sp. 201903070]|jgi:DNA-binding NarL/FixJ family response regulator|uniref:Response regulator transcription factor n=1 Tax=Leptospira ainlahdjerensis TaxID=2810033 RepID=A0ABS2U7T6_9LEPT|nr:response regulator transcription factor [Leptospira ainlahdjerensis]MBM9576419.1 response regulator transcription factor [Leptospira ainlahdjerensis]